VPKTKPLNQIGDTIVEVLLSVVVIGMAIGLAYGVATRSLKANRQAQERTEALKLAESQVERLKKLASTDTGGAGGVFDKSTAYCLVDGGGGLPPQKRPINTPPAAVASDPLTSVAYGSGACVSGLYFLSITPSPTPGSNQFDIRARWYGLGSLKKEEVVIGYRIYPAKP